MDRQREWLGGRQPAAEFPADLNARMGSYFTAHVASSDPSGLVPIALDGKMLRGALRAKATATHLVS
ncbi:hypothetical protein OSJ06_24920, partial [Mycobacterium ulcerans]